MLKVENKDVNSKAELDYIITIDKSLLFQMVILHKIE